jgi:hypothetical protein
MLKTKSEKLSEIIPLLKKLNEIGIPSKDSGYIATKELMDTWLHTEKDIINEEIQFLKYGRIGVLSMYAKQGKSPKFVLKATEELKDYIERKELEESEKSEKSEV